MTAVALAALPAVEDDASVLLLPQVVADTPATQSGQGRVGQTVMGLHGLAIA